MVFPSLQGGDLLCGEQASGAPPLLLQWVKTEHALLMLFNNGTLQVCRGRKRPRKLRTSFFPFTLCILTHSR